MSAETSQWLNQNVLIGFTDKRGNAWHYRRSDQGQEPNHYSGAIPLRDVERRLFGWEPIEGTVQAVVGDEDDAIVRSAPRHKAILRSDTLAVLGIVSPSYTIHDYRDWLLQNVSSLLGEAGIGSAGLLAGGARAWVQVEVPDSCSVKGVDFRPFLTATTSLDGSMATTYLAGAQVVVCDNTLRVAMKDKDAAKLRIRHSTRSTFELATAREALGILEAIEDAFAAQVKRQIAVKVDDEVWDRFLRAHFPLKNEDTVSRHPQFERRRELDRLWRYDLRVAPWQGTAYGVVAAVNTYEHHLAQGRAGRDRVERNADRATSGGFDAVDEKTLRTLQKVLPDAATLLAPAG
jgi:phage/plasmid-like protein (TIGR03299 family)